MRDDVTHLANRNNYVPGANTHRARASQHRRPKIRRSPGRYQSECRGTDGALSDGPGEGSDRDASPDRGSRAARLKGSGAGREHGMLFDDGGLNLCDVPKPARPTVGRVCSLKPKVGRTSPRHSTYAAKQSGGVRPGPFRRRSSNLGDRAVCRGARMVTLGKDLRPLLVYLIYPSRAAAHDRQTFLYPSGGGR